MVRITGIRFKRAGKVYYFDPGELELKLGEKAIVETVRGIEMGDVVIASKMVEDDAVVQPLKKVIRAATPDDIKHSMDNMAKETKALEICHEKIRVHELPMKLVGAEYTFDNSKVIFYFTAEGRVDFRELVKDLASVFKMRIELRQIGVRDEAKLVGGLGPCGLPMCCTSWLGDFDPVSIKMAKEQNLSLNPAKISGICGRLMCCLKFESGMYEGVPVTGGCAEQEDSYLMRETATEGKPEKCMKCGNLLGRIIEEDVEGTLLESTNEFTRPEETIEEANQVSSKSEDSVNPSGCRQTDEPVAQEAVTPERATDIQERASAVGKEKERPPLMRTGTPEEGRTAERRGPDGGRHNGRYDKRGKGYRPEAAAEPAGRPNEPGRAPGQKDHAEEQRRDDAGRPFRKKNPKWQEYEAREKKAVTPGPARPTSGPAEPQPHPHNVAGEHGETAETRAGSHNKNRRRRRGHRKPADNRGSEGPAQGE